MAIHTLDVIGLKCPHPILKIAIKARELKKGDILEVLADCPSFPGDLMTWCERTERILLYCADEGDGCHKAQIQF